jgi:hypothetical protein|tara:strand:+ start:133 stop:369 length:237 start_codon:yes stop_codon:yes gene_type:complete
MDKINMIDYQQYVLRQKFKKKKRNNTIRNWLTSFLFIVIFLLFFLNTGSRANSYVEKNGSLFSPSVSATRLGVLWVKS